jgi:hypothetical protein
LSLAGVAVAACLGSTLGRDFALQLASAGMAAVSFVVGALRAGLVAQAWLVSRCDLSGTGGA